MANLTPGMAQEIATLRANGQGVAYYKIVCRILNGKEWIDPLNVLAHEIERDYANTFSDKHFLKVQLGAGDYAYGVYPFRDSLTIDIITTPYYRTPNGTQRGKEVNVKRYKAVLSSDDSPGMTERTPQSSSRSDLNISSIRVADFELFDEATHQVRMSTYGGILSNVTPMDALKTVLTDSVNTVQSSGKQLISGISTMPGFNPTVRKQIIIPHGTRVVDMAGFLQQREGGIYPTGIGCYLQDTTWHVFSPFNVRLYGKVPRVLNITLVPPQRFADECTYRVEGNNIYMVTSGDRQLLDEGFSSQLNEGNGWRAMWADNILDGFKKDEANKTTVSRKENLYETISIPMKDNKSNVQWTEERATSNTSKHNSEMAKRAGRVVKLIWHNGDIDLLVPGMCVKLLATSNEKTVIYQGVLNYVLEHRTPLNEGAVREKFMTVMELGVFIERKEGI